MVAQTSSLTKALCFSGVHSVLKSIEVIRSRPPAASTIARYISTWTSVTRSSR